MADAGQGKLSEPYILIVSPHPLDVDDDKVILGARDPHWDAWGHSDDGEWKVMTVQVMVIIPLMTQKDVCIAHVVYEPVMASRSHRPNGSSSYKPSSQMSDKGEESSFMWLWLD